MKKKNFITTFFTSFFIFIAGAAEAQQEVPIPERNVYYIYQEFGLPNSDKLKVLVISSHIYRYKYNDDAYQRAETALSLAFGNKMSEIQNNEYNPDASSSNQVHANVSQQIEFGYSNGITAKSTGPEIRQVFTSSTELLRKSREQLIAEFEKKGYTIFQTSFDEYFDDHLNQMKLEKVERLSSLWIPNYRNGLIVSMAKGYQERSSSGGGGITIEERKDKSTTKTSTTKKQDNTDWAAIAAAKRWEAEGYEREGDRLLNLGELDKAAQQYKAAQAAFYTDRVQQKLNSAEGTLQAGAALIGGGLDKVTDVQIALDDMKIPKFSAWGISSGHAPSPPAFHAGHSRRLRIRFRQLLILPMAATGFLPWK